MGGGVEKYGAGLIVVSDYDPNWPTLFDHERTRMRNVLGSFASAIEHVGSTAVPGLPSKPIIDLLVGVPSLGEARHRCIGPIEALGYNYNPRVRVMDPRRVVLPQGASGTGDSPCALDGAILSSLGRITGVS